VRELKRNGASISRWKSFSCKDLTILDCNSTQNTAGESGRDFYIRRYRLEKQPRQMQSAVR
jgi:hypothetical protein